MATPAIRGSRPPLPTILRRFARLLPLTPNIDLQTRVEAAGGEYIDRKNLICPDGQSAPVRGDIYVFMDSGHVTATYLRTVTAALARDPAS